MQWRADRFVQAMIAVCLSQTSPAVAEDAGYNEIGVASWYGGELSGRPTASGERFDHRGFSAAHRTLPMPSYVEVTALKSGRTVLVRINDRGPMSRKRLIDLSQAAAQELGIVAHGQARVRVRQVEPDEQERAALARGEFVARPAVPSDELAGLDPSR